MSTSRMLIMSALTVLLAAGLYLGLRSMGGWITGPRPDLTFASFAAPIAGAPDPGAQFEIEILVRNLGPGVLDRTVKVVAFRGDPREGGDPERATTGQVDVPLEPGEHTRVTLPLTAPDEPGPIDLYFAIDPDRDVAETDLENNVLLSSIYVAQPRRPMVDLAVEEIRFDPPAPRSNQDVLITVVVANRGDAPTLSMVSVDLYINDPLGPLEGLPGTRRLTAPPLAVGESVELSARWRFDGAQLVATYARVDTDQEIDESSEVNNLLGPEIVAVGTAEQEGFPDLVVDAVELLDPEDMTIGTQGRIRVRVANVGGADTTSAFSVNVVYEPVGGVPIGFPPREDGQPSWSRDLRFLAAGQSFVLPLIQVPFIQTGEWTLAVDVDPYNEVAEGPGEENNQREMRWTVSARR